jgi:hypothetical protein
MEYEKKCIKDCKGIVYKDNWLYCYIYKQELITSLDNPSMRLISYMCDDCLFDSIIDDEPTMEDKVDWLIDELYSLKDEFQETVTKMYQMCQKI